MAVTKRPPVRSAASSRARHRRRVHQARPAAHGAESGDVRGPAWAACSPRSCCVRDIVTAGAALGFTLQIALWLWFTVLFANFAEAMAEGRGKAQADALRAVAARDPGQAARATRRSRSAVRDGARPPTLQRGRPRRRARRATLIPGDGEVVEGVASVDESAITGESAPVIRESGGDRSAVTGGTKVLSDYLVIRITANPGETFIDRMIALVEGASAAEDAERDRAHDPALGPHDHLPARGGDAAAVRRLQRRRRSRSRC